MVNQWEKIFKHLEKNGFTIYPPGTKKGECLEKYIVLVADGLVRVPGLSTEQFNYSLLLYVPFNNYSSLEPYIDSVRGAMKSLHPLIRDGYNVSSSFYDEAVKGYMVSLEYFNYRFIERR